MQKYTFLLMTLFTLYMQAYTVNYTITPDSNISQQVRIQFILEPQEILYKDSFYPSVNHHAIELSAVTPSAPAISFFDETHKLTKEGYKNNITFSFQAHKTGQVNTPKIYIHSHFNISSLAEPQQLVFPLSFSQITGERSEQYGHNNQLENTKAYMPHHGLGCAIPQPSLWGTFIQNAIDTTSTTLAQWKKALFSLFNSTGSRTIRLIAALILGILLSLTPCIYPMIPITVGILQANHSSSGIRNFILALCYTLGISVTFAILGLIAAVGSCVFGQLQGSPWVIIPLVALLGYLGLSMFGLYEMHIPKFLQPNNTTQVKGGSLLSAFVFGAVSGTIASPCMSPGLALILDWVSNLSKSGSFTAYTEGFLLLFIFGVGSSLPLLIIGTFSSSLNLLPRAGLWMVEVKKILGLMLIAMCFYHLSHLEKYLPWYILVWIIMITLFALGIYYFMSVEPYDSKAIKRFKHIMGTILIISSCFTALEGYKALYNHVYKSGKTASGLLWSNNYEQAYKQAQTEHKKLFVDIGASYCGSCKMLDNTLFKKEEILQALASYKLVKIEADSDEESFEEIKKQFGDAIKGFPTLLIINPENNTLLHKWDVSINDLSTEHIVEQFNNYSR